MEKMTYKTAIAYTLTLDLPTDVREKMEALLATYDRKSSTTKKLTPNQIANEKLKEQILDFLRDNAPLNYTISEIIDTVPGMRAFSVNKVSALVRALIKENKVLRSEVKRKAYFGYFEV